MGSQQSSHQNGGVATDSDSTSGELSRKRKRETTDESPSTNANDCRRTEVKRMDDSRDTDEASPSRQHSAEISYPSSRSKKRRRLSSQSIPPIFSKLWGNLSERTAWWFAKYCFLNFLEMATTRIRCDELASEEDVHNAIIHILEYFQKDDLDLLRRGWKALSIVLACPQRPGQLPAREDSLEEDAAIIAMVMQRCSGNGMVQILGCRALRILFLDEDTSRNASEESEKPKWKVIHQAGVLSALTDAVRSNPDNRKVQELCVSFIAVLIKEVGERVKKDLLNNGGIDILLQACQRWQLDSGVLHTILCVVYQLTSRSTRQALIDQGVVPLLSSYLSLHGDHRAIVELILGTMNQLAVASESIFAGQSLVQKLLILLGQHPDNDTIQFFGLVLLRAAGRSDPIPLQEAFSRIADAMKRFSDSTGVLFFCCALMWQLLQFHNNDDNEALALLSSNGAMELLLDAVQRRSDVYGLAPVAHLILMYAWEHRPRENEASTRAFGGSEDVASLVSGLDDFDIPANADDEEANGDDNN